MSSARSLPSLDCSCQGTLITITPASNSNRPLSRSALWLCSRFSHQRVDRDRGEGVRPGGPGVGERAQGGLVHGRDQDDGVHAAGQHQPVGIGAQLGADRVVVPADRDHHQVGAVGELGRQHDDQDQRGQDRAYGVDGAGAVHPAASGRVAFGGQRAFQCRTMPAWLSVNEVKTPRMYSWIRRVTEASNATSSAPAITASRMMPLLNVSRSPRVGGEDGQRQPLGQQRLAQPVAAERPADQQALEPAGR